jgi:hypothetical protein
LIDLVPKKVDMPHPFWAIGIVILTVTCGVVSVMIVGVTAMLKFETPQSASAAAARVFVSSVLAPGTIDNRAASYAA